MDQQMLWHQSFWGLIEKGGFAMYPLLACSLLVWGIILERLWSYRRLGHHLEAFHLEAMNLLIRSDLGALQGLCHRRIELPTARLLLVALERMNLKDPRLSSRWLEALERKRAAVNLELRRFLWILGTIGSAAPFIGLFGTVIGILRSFQDMARTGSGGFSVVASGISESLVATAAGIVVAVVAVLAFNAFQIRWNHLVLLIRLQTEELSEFLASTFETHREQGNLGFEVGVTRGKMGDGL